LNSSGICAIEALNTMTTTKKTSKEGQSLKPRTKEIYLLLIDMPPAEYDTMLTSMLKIKRLS